jgi:hypothetical protein
MINPVKVIIPVAIFTGLDTIFLDFSKQYIPRGGRKNKKMSANAGSSNHFSVDDSFDCSKVCICFMAV